MVDTLTQMADMIDPEVLAPMVQYALEKQLRFTPLAKIDDTLKGQPGDSLKFLSSHTLVTPKIFPKVKLFPLIN